MWPAGSRGSAIPLSRTVIRRHLALRIKSALGQRILYALDVRFGVPHGVSLGHAGRERRRSCTSPGASGTPLTPENRHSQEQTPGRAPENTASTVAQAGESTPENAALSANYAPADQE